MESPYDRRFRSPYDELDSPYSRFEETLGSLVTAIEGIEATIVTAAVLEHFQGRPEDLDASIDEGQRIASAARVVRLSKASPLEVLLQLPVTAGSIVAGTYGLAWGVIRLHNAYHEARITKARADTQVALYQQVERELAAKSAQQQAGQDQTDPHAVPSEADVEAMMARHRSEQYARRQLERIVARSADTFEVAQTVDAPES